jgi:hypothetical protein
MSSFEFSKENAISILRTRLVLNLGIKYEGVVVNFVSKVHMDENYEEFQLVYLRASTKRQAEFAMQAYNEGNYEKALNGNEEFGSTILVYRMFPNRHKVPIRGDLVNIRMQERWCENLKRNVEFVEFFSVQAPVVPKGINLTGLG